MKAWNKFIDNFLLCILNRYNEVRANAGADCSIILVGNKVDQRHVRAILYDEAKRYADARNIP